MISLLIIAWLGNLVDLIATLYLSGLGYVEANPIMACLLPYPWLFAIVKLVVMTYIVYRLYKHKDDKRSKVASWIACLLYGAITIYYIHFFTFWI